jgi:hypothetical protein
LMPEAAEYYLAGFEIEAKQELADSLLAFD